MPNGRPWPDAPMQAATQSRANAVCIMGINALAVCLSLGGVVGRCETVDLVRDDEPAATIVVARKDGRPSDHEGDEQLRKAAEELALYIRRLSGVDVPIRMDGARIDGAGLILGVFGQHASHGAIGSRPEDLPPTDGLSESAEREAFAIRAHDGNVYFSGRTNAAIAYAVLSFIEHDLGVRWFAPGELWEYLPSHDAGELTVEVEDRVVVPTTPLRMWSGHDDWDWKTRTGGPWNRWDWLNRASSRSTPIRNRLGNQLQGAFPAETYGEAHPEYYPLINGERFVPPPGPLARHNRFWPCTSNPEVVRVTADFIRSWFDADPFGRRRSFSLGMDDVTNLCQCDNCRALDPPGALEKDQFSDRNYAFVNAVAREVAKTHADHYIGALIYRQLRQPPVNVPRMESNAYGFLTQNCGTWWAPGAEEADKALTREWASRFGLPLGRYEYYGLGTFAPRFYPHALDRQIKFDRELGVDANYTEIHTFLPHTAPMIWAFSKLQWDATLDIDELLGEFYTKMFGPAAATVAEYYDLLERAWNTPRPGRTTDFSNTAGQLAVSRNRHEQVLAISPDEIAEGLSLLSRALDEADDAKVRERIEIVRDALIYSQLGIETYLLNQDLRARAVRTAGEAEKALESLKRYAEMIVERERFWAEAKQRDDLLGETIRRMGSYLVIDEFPQMDTTVASAALEVLDWWAGDADRLTQATEAITSMPWPAAIGDVMRIVAAAGGENLLENPGFETTGTAQTADANDDWTGEGAPEQWSLWIRDKPSDVPVSKAGTREGAGRDGSRGMVFESGQGGALIQSLPAEPGDTFLATVWMRAAASEEAEREGDSAGDAARPANLYVAFRDSDGNLFGPDRRLYANTVFGVPTGRWQRLVLHVTVPERAVSLVMMVGAHPIEAEGLSVVFDDPTLQRVVEPEPDASALKWNPKTVAAELERYEPALAEFGIEDPLRWARALVAEEDDWTAAQPYWERQIAHWRLMLLDDDPAGWSQWLNLDHPALAARRAEFEAGAERARRAWADHIAGKPGLLKHVGDRSVRMALFEAQEAGIYDADGAHVPDRAEALLEGKVHTLHLPVFEGGDDYDWVQNANDAGWFIKYLAMAYYHQRDDRWVREFQNEVVAMVMGYQIAGFTAVATRLRFILPTYLLMKDSPAMSERFHSIIGRWMWAHGRQLHAVGETGYKDNMLTLTGMAQWMTVAFFPEFRDSQAWEEQFWPRYEAGYRRDLLPDGTHEHRAFGYHLTYVYRGLSVLALAEMLGTQESIPEGFRELVGRATDAFAAVITPIRSTPGVNDDWEVLTDFRHVLQLGADIYDRPDWRYLTTDGRHGKPPRERSTLLPDGQLAVMRSGWSRNARWLFFNVSPEGGHHHCDTLGIQIWADGRQLLVEPYKGDYTFERDVYNRSWWHSTPTFGETLLPLRPEPKVLHWETGPKLDYAVGEITVPTGDDRPPATIRRHVFFVDGRFWVLWDEFEGLPDGQIVWENFHLPTREFDPSGDGRSVTTALPGGPNLLMLVGEPGWTMLQEDTRMWPVSSRDTVPTTTLHYEADSDVAARGFAALLVPFEGRKPPRNTQADAIERLDEGRVRLRVTVGGATHVLTTLDPDVDDSAQSGGAQ